MRKAYSIKPDLELRYGIQLFRHNVELGGHPSQLIHVNIEPI